VAVRSKARAREKIDGPTEIDLLGMRDRARALQNYGRL